MDEQVLHLVWKYCLLNQLQCYTTNGERIQIVSPGTHNNQNSGPDFSTSKIRIGDNLWVGNVEIHKKTSDWYIHRHHLDKAYENVVLHVVYEDDIGESEDSDSLPIIELKKCVNPEVWEKISLINKSKKNIPCSNFITLLNTEDWIDWQNLLVIKRFEKKAKDVRVLYNLNNKDWSKVVFQLLAKSLGGTVNKDPFMVLTRETPLEILNKHKCNLLSLESLLFGVAGMLKGNFKDVYPRKLQQEFQFLKHKYGLHEMDSHWWKWMRLRPNSFPTIQIAMLSSLLFNSSQIENLFGISSPRQFKKELNRLSVLSPYWENHYRFDKPAKEKVKNWGKETLERIYINSVIPYQIAKKMELGELDFSDELNRLHDMKAENNKIIRGWKELCIPVSSAYQSQALIQLFNDYCSRKKCLNCSVGLKVLKLAKYDQICKEIS